MVKWASQIALVVKSLPAHIGDIRDKTWTWSWVGEDPLVVKSLPANIGDIRDKTWT